MCVFVCGSGEGEGRFSMNVFSQNSAHDLCFLVSFDDFEFHYRRRDCVKLPRSAIPFMCRKYVSKNLIIACAEKLN